MSRPPQWNVGYTTRRHLCLDLDNTTFTKVCGLVKMIMRDYPQVGNCLIVKSSNGNLRQKVCYMPRKLPYLKTWRENYHAVFSGIIPYEESCRIYEALAYLGVVNEQYVRIREMRNDMTLRVSKTENVTYTKPCPVPLTFIINPVDSSEEDGILLYLQLLSCFVFQ